MSIFHLVPDKNGVGMYNMLNMEEGDAEIRGAYKILNLCGAHILDGRLYAAPRATAETLALAGAYIPAGTDLSRMETRNMYTQGLLTRELKLPNASQSIDLSFALIDELDMSVVDYTIDLNLRDGTFGTFYFGPGFHRKIRELDLRGTRIGEVTGTNPAEIRSIRMDEETEIPEEFRQYLDHLKRL